MTILVLYRVIIIILIRRTVSGRAQFRHNKGIVLQLIDKKKRPISVLQPRNYIQKLEDLYMPISIQKNELRLHDPRIEVCLTTSDI